MKSIATHFMDSVRTHGERCALVFRDEHVSYAALGERVESLARAFADRLPGGSRVAIHALKSIDTVVTMLACLRAGFAYVPVDPGAPIERRRTIVTKSKASALVFDAACARTWPDIESVCALAVRIGDHEAQGTRAVTLHELESKACDGSQVAFDDVDAEAFAYILFTSGSTGEPKGAPITQRNAAAFVQWGCDYFDIGPSDRVAVHAPLHFDLPVFDLYVTFARGGTVILIDERTVLFPEALAALLERQRVTVLYAVPSALVRMVQRRDKTVVPLGDIRLLLYAGEEFQLPALRRFLPIVPNARVFNLYGPIETNVVTVHEVARERLDAVERIPLGHPIAGTTITLLDDELRPVTHTDREGEITVFGPSVFPGYLNAEDPERNVATAPIPPDVFPPGAARGYRTGDYAKYDSEGRLLFLGRRDSLIKTRGFRVELGDVEANMSRHTSVRQAAAIAVPHSEYGNVIFAFVVLAPGRDEDEARLLAWCRSNLPSAMVPTRVFVRAELPSTSTGKIARRVLAEQVCDEMPSGRGVRV